MSPADSVREFLARRGCPPHVVAGGLAGLLAHWESVVDEVDAVYRLGLDDYLDDMDARQLLEDAVAVAPPEARQAIEPRLHEADQRMQRLVVAADRCLWGEEQAREHGWTPETSWWYFTRPAGPGLELREDLGL
jgi:hypothetical protein